jgi:hypothetical protein
MPANERKSTVRTIIFHNDYQRCFTRDGKPIGAIEIDGKCATLFALLTEEYALSPKNTYPYQGRQVPGQTVEFDSTVEPWSQYKLADGTEVKVKMILMNAARLDEFNEQGDPVYQFQFQQIIGIVAPDTLKRKAQ